HKWIGSESMSLADIAFAPYATRLEHLHLSAMWHHKPHFKDWYERLKRTEGYQQGLAGWFNPKYLELKVLGWAVPVRMRRHYFVGSY
ncbi:glutathione S-transferase domain-containing protein, partial [Porticoccaceae bacterium]|nr:glutathione S-transferase domain-containing protein [Porticoccaceae bacterium]